VIPNIGDQIEEILRPHRKMPIEQLFQEHKTKGRGATKNQATHQRNKNLPEGSLLQGTQTQQEIPKEKLKKKKKLTKKILVTANNIINTYTIHIYAPKTIVC